MPATKASPIANDTPHTGALLALAALATMAALLPGRAGVAAEPCEPSVGRIVSLQGLVEVQPAGAADWARAGLDDRLCIGDTIRAGAYSQAAVALANDSVASLDQLTTMRFVGESESGRSWLDLLFGDVHLFSHRPRALEVDTPIANAFTEGTEFLVRARPERTEVILLDGRIRLTSPEGEVLLASGDRGVAVAGAAPRREIVARPRDAVAWALYYPPILAPLAEGAAAPALPAGLQRALERVAEGDYAGALAALDAVPDASRDARYHTYRAGVLLNVGRVDEAAAPIERALAMDPEAAEALAERAVIAVVQNREEAALADARRAVDLAPDSAPARIALSYALQAAFDLEATREVLREAAARTPDDPLVFARLAEIELSFGDLDAAQAAAARAVALAPGLARTQMVLGFAALTRIEVDAAKAAFERAIELDSALPLARLGLGLARIREGDLEDGRRELEIAAALDPNTSLLRSYLGKAYFEERRGPLDADQFRIAKQLDPNDPTPWFYNAIRLQTENRPVEALRSLERSIELNNNRAVYRSRLLLDQDVAARQAHLGRIYSDVGFDQLALVEGWKSVAQDSANYSGHRLLADLYLTRPRHQIARNSELLQAQLFQPININPVQPSLAESGLTFLAETGPADVTFSEFTRLFSRNEVVRPLVDVLVGTDSTFADNLIASGIHNSFSYSFGQFHFETQGSRKNNDLQRNVVNAFAQTAISPETSILTELRYEDIEAGELNILFDPENFPRERRSDAENKSLRVGARRSFAPNSTSVITYVYNELEGKDEIPEANDQRLVAEEKFSSIEFRHVYTRELVNFDVGLGFLGGDLKVDRFIGDVQVVEDTGDIRLFNGYLYSTLNLSRELSVIAGLSFDALDHPLVDKEQINPKLGAIWQVSENTTLRAAAFRAFPRPTSARQTIEPTNLAGFNQFYDDIVGTDSRHYGIGLDQRIGDNIFVGTEYSKRDVEIPAGDVGNVNADEEVASLYAYWAAVDQIAVTVGYQYEKFTEDRRATRRSITELITHRLPLGVRMFHPSGTFGEVVATYYDQDGTFVDVFTGEVEADKADFWVADVRLGYRLPKRSGLAILEVRNLFNEKFKFQDTEPTEARIGRGLSMFARLTLTF